MGVYDLEFVILIRKYYILDFFNVATGNEKAVYLNPHPLSNY